MRAAIAPLGQTLARCCVGLLIKPAACFNSLKGSCRMRLAR